MDTSSQTPLLAALAASDQPPGLAELANRLPDLAPRSLQRMLARLVQQGHVLRSGRGPATVYALAPEARQCGPDTPAEAAAAALKTPDSGSLLFAGIPLSPEAREVLRLVWRPLASRPPVGWQRDWLDAYVPNQTFLLPESTRQRMARLGDTGLGEMPAGTYGRQVIERLLIDLSWASSHLEGNTYTRLDTRELIAYGRAAEGRAASETQMILNHKAAIELLVDQAGEGSLDRRLVQGLHAALSENLLPDPIDEGRLRQRPVYISGSSYRPLSVPQQVSDALTQVLNLAVAIDDPFEQSFFLLTHLAYLQPFVDVNKRTARLLANWPLLQKNLCPLTFIDVPRDAWVLALLGVYELTRPELLADLMVWAYERSSNEYVVVRESMATPDPLRLQFREPLRDLVRAVIRQPDRDPLELMDGWINTEIPLALQIAMRDLASDELRRLHDGTLARYGLRPSEWERWLAARG